MPCPQYSQLQAQFPKTTKALVDTFLPGLPSAVTDSAGHNLAGHVLYHLSRVLDHASELHGKGGDVAAAVDEQSAAEVSYQHSRRVTFRNPVPALGTCLYNRVHERAEKYKASIAQAAGGRFPRRCDTAAGIAAVLPTLPVRLSRVGGAE